MVFVCGRSTNQELARANHLADSVPSLLTDVLLEWQMKEAACTPAFQSWKREYQHSEAITFDSFVNNVISNHMVGTTNLKMGNATGINSSTKYAVNILLNFVNELQLALPAGIDVSLQNKFRSALLPFALGCFDGENIELATSILERVLGETEAQAS